MTEIPQERVEKAAEALPRYVADELRQDLARAVLAAVLPDVRRAVAEEIAAAIQEERERYANGPQDGPQPFISVGLMYAQGIAREIGEA